MRSGSIVNVISSIKRAAKNVAMQRLSPSKNSTKHSHRRRANSSSSWSSSSDSKLSYSSISNSESNFSSSGESRSRFSGRSRGHRSWQHGEIYSKNSRKHKSRRHKQSHHKHHRSHTHHNRQNDAEQMIDLLARMLPFYGTGDYNSDALVIDTVHRLPSHALEIADPNGTTLLLLVCQFAAYDLLPALLAKGCDVNASNNAGATPLHFACFSDTFSAESAMTLLRHGATAEVVEQDYGCTPLHWAAYAGHTELCRVLCIAGANPSTLDKGGNDPISYCRQSGNPECTALLESFVASGTGKETNLRWDRMIDSSTGSSFYYNKDTGESLWGDTFRSRVLPAESDGVPKSPSHPVKSIQVQEAINTPNQEEPVNDTAVSTHGSTAFDPHILSTDEFNVESTYTSPDRRSRTSLQGPLDEIVEVESLSSKEDGSNVAVNLISKLKSLGDKPNSTHSWEKDEETSQVEDKETVQVGSLDEQEGASESAVGEPVAKVKNISLGVDEQSKPEKHPYNAKSNRSFEDRMNVLHERMENQLLQKLQHLEEKFSRSQQQSVEVPEETLQLKEDTMRLKRELSESTQLTMELRTEIATKDLEMLKLKQQLIHIESSLRATLEKPVTFHVGVGDGELNPEKHLICEKDLLAEKVSLEKELADTKLQFAAFQTQSLSQAQYLADTEIHLKETREQLADEKASRVSMMLLLEEKSKNDERVDSALVQSLVEEKERSALELSKLKEKLEMVTDSFRTEKKGYEEKLKVDEEQILDLKAQLADGEAAHNVALVKLIAQHDKELNELKCSLLKSHKDEFQEMQDKLREEQLQRMELELKTTQAVNAMEVALEQAADAEAKLKAMTDAINEATTLKIANEQLHSSLQAETEKRKILHNTIEDMKGRIRVYVRVRPLNENEVKAGYKDVLTKEDDRTIVMAADQATSTEVKDWEFDKIFSGSHVHGNTQEAVFDDTSLLITSAIDGFNVCIFAYGQTGSGKTYTMFGGEKEQQGIAPRVAFELFKKLQEKEASHSFEVSISMLELYTDRLRDLFSSKDDDATDLKIHLAEHTPTGLVEVDGANVKRVKDGTELLDTLNRGAKSRASSSTKMNADSSRSHMIATIVLSLTNKRTGNIIRGKLTLVDLAGSERVGKSGAAGVQLKEAQSINKSLSSLGDVIGALTSSQSQHIPYRNHPLTMLMSDSLGGNAKTLMFLCCSPADWNRRETTNSLDFAKRCRNVTNKVVSSGGNSNVNQIRALQAELSSKNKHNTTKRRSAGMRRPGMT